MAGYESFLGDDSRKQMIMFKSRVSEMIADTQPSGGIEFECFVSLGSVAATKVV